MHSTNNPTNLNITKLSDELFSHLLMLFSMIVAWSIYGTEIWNFSVSIDEEVQSFDSNNWLTWISQGRWGMGVLTYISPDGLATMPYLPTLLFAIGLAISAVMFSKIFTHNRESAIVFIGVFVSSPIWLHIGEFNTLSWGFSIGLILTAFALKLINCGGTKNAFIAGTLVGFCLGIYQALFFLYLSLTLLLCIKNEWCLTKYKRSNFIERNGSTLLNLLISIVLAVLIYLFINQIFIHMTSSSLSYLNNFVNMTAYTNGNSGLAIQEVIKHTRGLILGSDSTFLGVGIPSLLLFWTGAIFAVKELIYSKVSVITKTYVFVLSIGILIVAVLLIILSAGVIPTRAMIVFPLVYATLSAYLFKYKYSQRILWAMFGIMLFVNIYIANSLFHADQVARQRDLVMATRLIDNIENVGRGVFGKKIPLVVVGYWQHELAGPARRVEIFGDSFFEHDGGNPYRIAAYLRLLGCIGLTPLPITAVTDELANIHLQPSWPAKGSVFMGKNAVIVKLSEPSYQQLQTLQNR